MFQSIAMVQLEGKAIHESPLEKATGILIQMNDQWIYSNGKDFKLASNSDGSWCIRPEQPESDAIRTIREQWGLMTRLLSVPHSPAGLDLWLERVVDQEV